MKTLVTGVAGFIGFHVARQLLARGDDVVGIDNINDYYDKQLKLDRLEQLKSQDTNAFDFRLIDFADDVALSAALDGIDIIKIVHLGAQAGVRYSLENPRAYISSNLVGHFNLMELARDRRTEHFVYASSSSVYGCNPAVPFDVADRVDHPVSLYAATKKSDELMSETYAHLHRIAMTGLRFFTVYGPWSRPDMAVWTFTRKILAGEPIQVFNYGKMRRDFTYIDDIVHGVISSLDNPPPDDGTVKAGGSVAPHRLYNIGNHRPEELMHLISLIEEACGRKAEIQFLAMQPGDVPETYADIGAIRDELGFEPKTNLADGIPRFVNWYRSYVGAR